MPACSTSSVPDAPSRPTQDEQCQPPSLPCGSDGLDTEGITQVPTAVLQVPLTTPPDHLLLLTVPSARFRAPRRTCVTPGRGSSRSSTRLLASHGVASARSCNSRTAGGSPGRAGRQGSP